MAALEYDARPMTVESPSHTCPRCEASVPPDAKFCANCGPPLTEASTDDAAIHARLTAAAPTPLITKMRATRLTGERKPVTALFADVVGSTTLAEQMDPEDWTAMINEAFDLMSRAVFRYEGTIAQLQGDAMLAFFGAPIAVRSTFASPPLGSRLSRLSSRGWMAFVHPDQDDDGRKRRQAWLVARPE